MGKGDYNYTIGKMNGRAESTVNFLIKDFCQAIVEILWEKSVAKLFPKQEEDFRQLLSIWNQRGNSSPLFLQFKLHTYQQNTHQREKQWKSNLFSRISSQWYFLP